MSEWGKAMGVDYGTARIGLAVSDDSGKLAHPLETVPAANLDRAARRIAELVREKKLEGIADLRDESDKRGMSIVIELKLLRDKQSLVAVQKEGLAQTANYAQRCGADEAHLVIFDRRANKPWSKRIWRNNAVFDDVAIGVWGA
mgnify:CR=1 FL=1